MSSATAMTHHQACVIVDETISELPNNSLTPSGDFGGIRARCRAALRHTRLSVERGATAVEYALMVGLISVGIVTAVTALKDKTTDSLNQTAASTSGLIFPPRVKSGQPFKVKYIRNDLGVGGWTGVGAKGATLTKSGAVTVTWDNLTKNGVEWTATLTAPAAGNVEVQVRQGGTDKLLETGVLRVTP